MEPDDWIKYMTDDGVTRMKWDAKVNTQKEVEKNMGKMPKIWKNPDIGILMRSNMIKFFNYFIFFGLFVACKSKKDNHTYDLVLHNNNHIPSEKASKYFERGLQYVEKGDFKNAELCFLQADKVCPNTPVILNAIGNAIVRIEPPEHGLPYYEKALKADSSFVKTYVNFGCCLNDMRDYERAKHILYLGLSMPCNYKTDRRALFLNLANSYYFEKDYRKALTLLDSAKSGFTHDQVSDMADEFEKKIRTNFPSHSVK